MTKLNPGDLVRISKEFWIPTLRGVVCKLHKVKQVDFDTVEASITFFRDLKSDRKISPDATYTISLNELEPEPCTEQDLNDWILEQELTT